MSASHPQPLPKASLETLMPILIFMLEVQIYNMVLNKVTDSFNNGYSYTYLLDTSSTYD